MNNKKLLDSVDGHLTMRKTKVSLRGGGVTQHFVARGFVWNTLESSWSIVYMAWQANLCKLLGMTGCWSWLHLLRTLMGPYGPDAVQYGPKLHTGLGPKLYKNAQED